AGSGGNPRSTSPISTSADGFTDVRKANDSYGPSGVILSAPKKDPDGDSVARMLRRLADRIEHAGFASASQSLIPRENYLNAEETQDAGDKKINQKRRPLQAFHT
ncbi:unnamed protein product, partial [Amoebophrya sp. A120]